MAYNLTGQKFNRLTVLKKYGHMGKKVTWECLCDCGKTHYAATNDLTSGNTKSCGCLNAERVASLRKTHGQTKSPLYDIWCGIKQRCYYVKHKQYANYGGRGIKICDRWLSFENFYADMHKGFKPGLSIERLNNDGDYCKENCTWADAYQQANNKRSNRVETVRGITDTVANLIRRFNAKPSTIYIRLSYGWNIEDALFKPPQKNQYKQKDA